MTEYEIADIAASVLANFLTSFAIFLSIVSAYVISAFIAGQRLSHTQLLIVNMCFLISMGILGDLIVSLFRRFFGLVQSLQVERGLIGEVDFTWPLSLLLLFMTLGSLIFMWSVRNEEEPVPTS